MRLRPAGETQKRQAPSDSLSPHRSETSCCCCRRRRSPLLSPPAIKRARRLIRSKTAQHFSHRSETGRKQRHKNGIFNSWIRLPRWSTKPRRRWVGWRLTRSMVLEESGVTAGDATRTRSNGGPPPPPPPPPLSLLVSLIPIKIDSFSPAQLKVC